MPNISEDIDLKFRLDAGDLAQLIAPESGWRLSLFLPLEKSSHEAKVGSILLRDLKREAEKRMDERLIGPAERENLLAPIEALLHGADARIYHGEGLALYASESYCKTVMLSEPPAPMVEVDRNFRLDALHGKLRGKDRFHLLCLSLHDIQLWEGDGVSMKRIPLEGLETDIRAALDFEDSDSQVQFHTNSSAPSRNKSKGQGSSFFGVGSSNHDRKREFLDFFRIIGRGIAAKLTDKDIPLLLAGVEYLMPIYREANTHSRLSALQVPGATHATGPIGELHGKVSALLREESHREILAALSEYRESIATERTVSGFTDVVPCAYYKKLTHLFIRKGSRQWGSFSPKDGRTDILDGYRPGAEDLVNLACVRTLMGHGKVYVVEDGEMPTGSGIAGLCLT